MEAGRVRFLVHVLLLLPLFPAFLLDEALDGQERREESHEEVDRTTLEEPGGGIRSIPPRLLLPTDNVSSSTRVGHSLARIHSISQKILGRARQRKKELLARRLTAAINKRRQVKTFLSTREKAPQLRAKSSATSTSAEISTEPPSDAFDLDESTETAAFSPTTVDPSMPTTSELLLAFLKPADTIVPRQLTGTPAGDRHQGFVTGEIPALRGSKRERRVIAHFSEFTTGPTDCTSNDDGCENGGSREYLTTPDPLDLRITTPAWAEQEEALGVNDLSMLEEEDVRLPQMALLLPVDTLKRDTDSRTRAFDEDSTSTLDTELRQPGPENTVSIDLIITAEMGSNNIKSDMASSHSDDKSKTVIKQQGKTSEFTGGDIKDSKEVVTLAGADCDSNGGCHNEAPAGSESQVVRGNKGGLRRSGSSCSNESSQSNGSCVNEEERAEIGISDVETGNIKSSEPVTPLALPSTATQLLDCSANGANCRKATSFGFDEVFAELDLIPGHDDEATTVKFFLTEHTTDPVDLTTDGMTEGQFTEMTSESPKGSVCHTESTTMMSGNDTENPNTSTEECESESSTEDAPGKGEEMEGLLSELEGLKAFEIGLSGRDQKIVLALMELEELRGKQHDMKHEIQAMLSRLEGILLEEDANRTKKSSNQETGDDEQEPRAGKTLSPEAKEKVVAVVGSVPGLVQAKVASTNTTFHFFNNLEHQIHTQLQNRLHFLEVISNTMQRELQTFKQTVDFLKRIVNFKLDQTEILLGEMNPITEILQSGSTSIFLLITSFFEAVEAVFVLKSDFVRAFNGQSMDKKEANLLEKIIELKLKTILPRKLRLLVNIYAHSEELRAMIGEIFRCVGELLIAKRDLIASVGTFVEQKVEFLSGLTGPAMDIRTLVEAVRSGTLYQLINFGPHYYHGLPIPPSEIEHMVEEMLAGMGPGPSVPFVGPIKPLLVNHRLLGALAGRARERVVNRFLAKRLSYMLSASHTLVKIREGETLMSSSLPPLSLGTPCENEMELGHSQGTVTVARSSRFSATTGLTVNSHAPPTADLFAHANIHVHMDMKGSFWTSRGKWMFGRCISQFSGSSPVRIQGRAYGHVFAKVVSDSVRLEVRRTAPNPLLGNFIHVPYGVERPHLVFTFNIQLDGTLHSFDSNFKMKGCQFKILGIKMFSMCGLLEKLVRKQVEKATRNRFPLRPTGLLRDIEKAIRMRLGNEVAIPLAVMDGPDLEPAVRVINKTERLIELNARLFRTLVSFTSDMVQVDKKTHQ